MATLPTKDAQIGEDMRERKQFIISQGMKNVVAILENSMEIPQKGKVEFPQNLIGTYHPTCQILKIIQVCSRRGNCAPVHPTALFIMVKTEHLCDAV